MQRKDREMGKSLYHWETHLLTKAISALQPLSMPINKALERLNAPHQIAQDPVLLAWDDTRRRYRIPEAYVEHLLEGIAQDVTVTRYQTFDELTHYCYGVASTVGLMSMHIIGYSSLEAVGYAIKLGIALQLHLSSLWRRPSQLYRWAFCPTGSAAGAGAPSPALRFRPLPQRCARPDARRARASPRRGDGGPQAAMTYFDFLVRFLVVPILALLLALVWDRQRRVSLPSSLRNLPAWAVILLHVLIAVLYTTPWDNYLVATRVWWYDTDLVTGITLGWVPIEEYAFFMLQALLTGLWLLWLAPRLERAPRWAPDGRIRRLAVIVAGLLWLPMPFLLAARVMPATYLALILVWALPPVALQLAFGADFLWRYRRLVAAAILPPRSISGWPTPWLFASASGRSVPGKLWSCAFPEAYRWRRLPFS